MRTICFKCPDQLLDEVNNLIRNSRYTNRSELLRQLLRQWVEKMRTKREVII